jgi:hypothetical protein
MPEPKFATTSVNPTIAKSGAQVRPAAYTNAVVSSGNGCEAGHASCAAYTSNAERIPIATQVSAVATGMLRRGFSASSERVEMPSKPI